MERLTTRLPDGGARRNCDSCEMQKICGPYDCLQRMVNRLASYEDTELSPEEIEDLASVREISPEAEYAINAHADSIIERLDKLLKNTDEDARIRELAAADKGGRALILPCKVGDAVWFARSAFRKVDSPIEATVTGFASYGTTGELIYTTMTVEGQITRRFLEHQIGKTAFLSFEEAERALEGQRDV